MTESFENMLAGGHPNSLGRTEEVVDLVLAHKARLADLYRCYFSDDEVVRLRVASAMKRVAIAQPEWAMEIMDGLQGEIAAIDQASNQWTLALIFDLTRDLLSNAQTDRAKAIMKSNLESHGDWIVLNNSMRVLFDWSDDDPELRRWLGPQLVRLTGDGRKSVEGRARKLLAELGE